MGFVALKNFYGLKITTSCCMGSWKSQAQVNFKLHQDEAKHNQPSHQSVIFKQIADLLQYQN